MWGPGANTVADPGEEWGHPAVCVRALSGHILLTPSYWIPAAGAGGETCLKTGAITHPCGVGVVGLEMVRYVCGVLWKPDEVPHLFVGALATDSGAAVLWSYCLCCRAVSSPSRSHLSATCQPPFSCSLLRVT